MFKYMFVFVCLFISVGANAEKTKREYVEELLHATKEVHMLDEVLYNIDLMFIDYYERKVSTPSDRVAFDKFVRQIQELKKEELNWDIIKDSVIDVYCEKFTQKEIEEMLAFYTSETGKAMMEKLPNAMSDARKFSSKAIHSFMPKVFEIEQELKDTLEDSSVSE